MRTVTEGETVPNISVVDYVFRYHRFKSLVVLGQNIAPAEMSKILKTGVRTITEDQFWDYIADEPM